MFRKIANHHPAIILITSKKGFSVSMEQTLTQNRISTFHPAIRN